MLLAVTGLWLNVWIGRYYGAAALGIFHQVTTAYIFFSMAAAGGMNYSVLRAVAEHSTDRAKTSAIVTGGLVPAILLSAVVAFAFYGVRGLVAAIFDSPDVAEGMAAAAPGLFCFALNKLLLAVVNGARRMRAFAIYQALRYTLILVGLVVCRAFELPGAQLAFVWTFSEGLLLLVLAVEVGWLVRWRERNGWLAWSRSHLAYGVKSVLSAMMLELNAKVDIWMLGAMLADARVGIYAFAASVAEGVYQLAVVLQNNFNPLLARDLAQRRFEALETMVRRARRWIVPGMAVVCAIAALVYPWTLPVFTDDPAFAASSLSFAILVGGIALASAYLPFNNLLLMAGQPGWHTLYMALVVLTNVIFNSLLIPRFEIEGAALGTAIAFIASAVLLRVFAIRRVGVRI